MKTPGRNRLSPLGLDQGVKLLFDLEKPDTDERPVAVKTNSDPAILGFPQRLQDLQRGGGQGN